ncbi:MAG: hypothetical protein Q7S31_03245 [bacterium]|nr:hypothetical protein [bacterium]
MAVEISELKNLPTAQEIANHRGFPSVAEEMDLQRGFFADFDPRVPPFIKDQSLNYTPTPNQQLNFEAFLYGVYFYNYVCGGRVINRDLSVQYQHALTRKGLVNPELGELSTWPLETRTCGYFPAETDMLSRIIGVDLAAIEDNTPGSIYIYYATQSLPFGIGMTYDTSLGQLWTCIGVEEASHADLLRLEETNYLRHQIPVPLKDFELPSKKNKSDAEAMGADDADYYSKDGREFAAFVVCGEYIHRYCPKIWDSGYQQYNDEVRKRRRKLVLAEHK